MKIDAGGKVLKVFRDSLMGLKMFNLLLKCSVISVIKPIDLKEKKSHKQENEFKNKKTYILSEYIAESKKLRLLES